MTKEPQNHSSNEVDYAELIEGLSTIRDELLAAEATHQQQIARVAPTYHDSALNLLHYVALRHRDMRGLQERLAELGLSSLGRAEGHVLSTLDAVLMLLHRASGMPWTASVPPGPSLHHGRTLLKQHTDALLGPPPAQRTVRVMVTMPSEAASDYELVRDLLAAGMDCMRINCAHDDSAAWEAMIGNLRRAQKELSRSCRVSMDIAGPKLRTGPITPGPEILKIRPKRDPLGRVLEPARLLLVRGGAVETPVGDVPRVTVAEGSLATLKPGDRLELTDTRGSRRRLLVTEHGLGWVLVHCKQTTYLGSDLELVGVGDPLQSNALRLGRLAAKPQSLLLRPGDRVVLSAEAACGRLSVLDDWGRQVEPAILTCTMPQVIRELAAGQRIWFDDGRIGGVVESASDGEAMIRIEHAALKGAKLTADKGINLPDSKLRLPALTPKDIDDLSFIVAHADLVEMSFVRTPEDVDLLDELLAHHGRPGLGVVLKIENRQAFENLPALALAVMRFDRAGLMIARGDLAVECGYERLAEVQEEILWICEAAHLPVIWATQVLESMAKTGVPSRAEVTDAAMGERAECVMLNKGPHLVQTVVALDDILRRMQEHQRKKTAMLRRLRW